MAEVDFSNAVISLSTALPLSYRHIGLREPYASTFFFGDNSGNNIVRNLQYNLTLDEKQKFKIAYQGTFITSGNNFYMIVNNSNYAYKISNINFNNGDTFYFEIEAELVCS